MAESFSLNNLFRAGLTREQFLAKYNELKTTAGAENSSVFTQGMENAIAQMFDTLNTDGNDTLDDSEITRLAAMAENDDTSVLSEADLQVLYNEVAQNIAKQYISTNPVQMYQNAMQSASDPTSSTYIEDLDIQISTLNDLITARRSNSTTLTTQLQNQIDDIILKSTKLSNDFKTKYKEASEKAKVHCVIVGFTCKDYNEDVINNVSKENPGKHSLNSELSGLPFDYMTPRPFRNNEVRFLSDEKGERFVIKGSKAHLTDIKSRNIVVRRQTSFKFEYSVTMDIPRLSEGQHLGITGYYDENTFLLFGIMKKDGANFLFAQEHIGTEDRFVYGDSPLPSGYANCDANEYNTAPDAGITLLMKTHYLKRDLYYKFPGMEDFALFTTLDNVYYLCDEGYNVGKRFTGALVGMYAYAGAKEALVATFNNPNYC